MESAKIDRSWVIAGRVVFAVILAVILFAAHAGAQVAPPDSIPMESSVEIDGSNVVFLCEYGQRTITVEGYTEEIYRRIPAEDIRAVYKQSTGEPFVGIFCRTELMDKVGNTHPLIGFAALTVDDLKLSRSLFGLENRP